MVEVKLSILIASVLFFLVTLKVTRVKAALCSKLGDVRTCTGGTHLGWVGRGYTVESCRQACRATVGCGAFVVHKPGVGSGSCNLWRLGSGDVCTNSVGNDKEFELHALTCEPVPMFGCQSNPCKFGSTCVNQKAGNYSCRCAKGFTGKNCDQDINECSTLPCVNTVAPHCTNVVGDYVCHCRDNWIGQICDQEISAHVWQNTRMGKPFFLVKLQAEIFKWDLPSTMRYFERCRSRGLLPIGCGGVKYCPDHKLTPDCAPMPETWRCFVMGQVSRHTGWQDIIGFDAFNGFLMSALKDYRGQIRTDIPSGDKPMQPVCAAMNMCSVFAFNGRPNEWSSPLKSVTGKTFYTQNECQSECEKTSGCGWFRIKKSTSVDFGGCELYSSATYMNSLTGYFSVYKLVPCKSQVHPCDIYNGSCEHKCTRKTNNERSCSCNNGYSLNSDGMTCHKNCVDNAYYCKQWKIMDGGECSSRTRAQCQLTCGCGY